MPMTQGTGNPVRSLVPIAGIEQRSETFSSSGFPNALVSVVSEVSDPLSAVPALSLRSVFSTLNDTDGYRRAWRSPWDCG